MYLDLCLLSCDLNPTYYDFFPLIQKYWKSVVGIDCLLVLIATEIPFSLDSYKDSIILFPPAAGIPTAFQAQCIRLLYPCLLPTYKGIIISDMDIVPLNKDFFCNTITGLYQNTFCIYRDVISEYQQYPICYCAASSETWKDIFHVNSKEDIYRTLRQWFSKNDYAISSASSEMWAQDQLQLFKYIHDYSSGGGGSSRIAKYSDEQTSFTRLDRADIYQIIHNVDEMKKQIKEGKFCDFHLPRPLQTYRNLLEALLL